MMDCVGRNKVKIKTKKTKGKRPYLRNQYTRKCIWYALTHV